MPTAIIHILSIYFNTNMDRMYQYKPNSLAIYMMNLIHKAKQNHTAKEWMTEIPYLDRTSLPQCDNAIRSKGQCMRPGQTNDILHNACNINVHLTFVSAGHVKSWSHHGAVISVDEHRLVQVARVDGLHVDRGYLLQLFTKTLQSRFMQK